MNEKTLAAYLAESAEVIRASAAHVPEAKMGMAVKLCVAALRKGKSILVCGNGGSASDAIHITGELVGRFLKNRKGLRCICLSDNPATLTAWANDVGFESVFARQVEAYGESGGVLVALSTSGNSPNILTAIQQAKTMGLSVVGLTGQGGGKMAPLCDVLFDVPSGHTPFIQQAHVCLYHYICEMIEAQMAA